MGVKMAENWIDDHKYDPDFEEQLVITGKAEEEKKQLTPEEAKQKLKELTEKARAIKKQREEEDNLEREKNRMRSGKEMVEAKRIAEEQAAKRQIELDRIQKARDEEYKRKLVE
jgi:UBX domain-containing protein 1/4